MSEGQESTRPRAVPQFVDTVIVPSSTAIADGLLATALDLREGQQGHPEAAEGISTLRLRQGSQEKALFLVAFTDDMMGHGVWREESKVC